MDTQQQYRGPKNKLPTLLEGQFGYCTDTKELYIGTSSGNVLIGAEAWKTEIDGKLTASKTAAVGTLSETATLTEAITTFNTLIANLKTSGVMTT